MNATELTNADKLRLLPWHTRLNAFNNVYAQLTFFGSAFILFLNTLNIDYTQIGLLLSALPFFGVVALFIAPSVARFGYKRTFLLFYSLRKVMTSFLLLVPFVLHEFGTQAAIGLITAVVLGFAFCRAVAETGMYPWSHEFVPPSVRGKHAAMNDMVSRITGTAAIIAAGFILADATDLQPFMILFVIALVFGVAGIWSAAHLPGGKPTAAPPVNVRSWIRVFQDRNFTFYMLGLYLVTLASAPIGFLPLFMQNEIGLTNSQVVWLQLGGIAGGFSAIYLVGWAADRYGSKPVMLTGLIMRALLPIGWLIMPRFSESSLAFALLIAFIWGVAEVSWGIGSGRLLFVSVVPAAHKNDYIAVFYSTIGIVGGITALFGGVLLDLTSDISGNLLFVSLDPFTPLFIGSIVLTVLAALLFSRRVQVENELTVGTFAALFTHGNPFLALQSLVRYHRFTDERSSIRVTERMGATRSPLTVGELMDSLHDPRFNVRFEAIITIARMPSDPRLVRALCALVSGTELSLSVIAAWALGRMGDESALPTLRAGLDSPYRSIQAHCARALATLDDQASAPLLLERLAHESDKGLLIAYASALGRLKHAPALSNIFVILNETENEGARMELALAIARIDGDEERFVRLLRGMRTDRATTAAQTLMTIKRRFGKRLPAELATRLSACADLFARDHMDDGARTLADLITTLKPQLEHLPALTHTTLIECHARLQQHGGARLEYIVLTLDLLIFSETKDA